MTIEKLKKVIENLPDYAVVMIKNNGSYNDVECAQIEYHNDGRAHLVLTDEE